MKELKLISLMVVCLLFTIAIAIQLTLVSVFLGNKTALPNQFFLSAIEHNNCYVICGELAKQQVALSQKDDILYTLVSFLNKFECKIYLNTTPHQYHSGIFRDAGITRNVTLF